MRITAFIIVAMAATFVSSACHAQALKAKPGDWPWWRGPNFSGVAEAGQNPAVEWSASKNVVWKTSVPGRGHSSPIVVGDRVFLTTADDQEQVQSVLCFDRQTGKPLWKTPVNQGGFPPRIHRKNTHASPTIASDGGRLFATHYHHGGLHVAALDLDGKIIWRREAGRFDPQEYRHGYGASPALYGDTVIIAGDYDGDGFLTALDRKTGKTVWRSKRPEKINFASPAVAHVAGRDQLLLSGCDVVAGYDPRDGKLLWQTPATTMVTAGTPVWEGDLVFAAGGYPNAETVCVRADGSGEVVWRNNQRIYEQSMLVHNGYVYAINDSGIVYCWKADTGAQMWRERLRGPVSASPILAGGNIYISNEKGVTWVFRATPERFTLVAKNQLGSEAFASPTICGNQIFLRVAEQVGGRRQEVLYCIQALRQTRRSVSDNIDRPNIILCMADDQGWGDVGYYGKSPARTPVLDEMAVSGLRLDRFYAAAPVCSPTRGSVMTGRHPNRFACFSWGHSLRPEEVTIAEALKKAGYTTGHFGKWHLGSVDARSDVSPGASGFDRWFSSPNFFDNDPLMSDNGRVVSTKGESSIVTMNAAIEFIRKCAAKEQPFLAVVWFGSPHNPHIALEKDRELYADRPAKVQHYYGEITGIDRSMGMLRKELRRLRIADNTLLWYTSDNGPQGPKNRGRPGSSGGLRDRKGTLWEGGIRVPTIIEWPARIPKSRNSSVACSTVDIFPTLLDIVGVDIDKDQPPLDGISILPLIDGKMTRRPKPMGFWSYPAPGMGMRSRQILAQLQQAQSDGRTAPLQNDQPTRDGRAAGALKTLSSKGYVGHAALLDNQYKLHRLWNRKTGAATYELYDLKADAAESRDLAGQMPERVTTMKRQLEAWQRSVARSLAGKDYP